MATSSLQRGSAVKRPTATTGSQRDSRTANSFHTNFNHSFMKGTNHPLVGDIKNSVIRHRSGGSSWLIAYINKGSGGRPPGGRHAARHVTAANPRLPRLLSFSVVAKKKKKKRTIGNRTWKFENPVLVRSSSNQYMLTRVVNSNTRKRKKKKKKLRYFTPIRPNLEKAGF